MTSAATPPTSLAAELVEATVQMPGADPLSGSVQKKNRAVLVLHNAQAASPGATTSRVRGSQSSAPPPLCALMLLPPGAAEPARGPSAPIATSGRPSSAGKKPITP